MKQLFLLLIYITLSHAQELPTDVKNLLEKRNTAVSAIDKRLVEKLEKLKFNYTRRGDLDSANAIVELIAKYKPEDAVEAKDEKIGEEMKNKLIGTKWVWFRGETITFMDNGRALWNHNNRQSFTWEVTDEKKRVISGITPRGREYKIQFFANFAKGEITEGAVTRQTMIIK